MAIQTYTEEELSEFLKLLSDASDDPTLLEVARMVPLLLRRIKALEEEVDACGHSIIRLWKEKSGLL